MARLQKTEYFCDNCGKKLKTCSNQLNIVTDKSRGTSAVWSRLHVRILHRHGVHNEATEEQAELCQGCATNLLQDALSRVKKGERQTAGAGSIDEETWE